jgi:hypothetical protein
LRQYSPEDDFSCCQRWKSCTIGPRRAVHLLADIPLTRAPGAISTPWI